MWQLSPRQEETEKFFTLFKIIFLYLLQQNIHATNWKMREKLILFLKSQTMQLSYRKTGWHLHLEGKLLKVTEPPVAINEKAFHIVCSNRHVLAV